MLEIIIKISGNSLLNEKVEELVKVTREIQETEDSLNTKMEIKNKKEKLKEPPKKAKKAKEDEEEDFSELSKDAKSLFIKLTKKDKPKAKKLLEKYDVESFTELEKSFKDNSTKWKNLIKRLESYIG